MEKRLAFALLLAGLALPGRVLGITVSQSTSTTVQAGHSVSCNTGGIHYANAYYRAFDLTTAVGVPLQVTSVDIGIEGATAGAGAGGQQPVSVRLYTSSANPPTLASLSAPVASADIMVADQALTLLNVPLSASFAGNEILVLEVFTPGSVGGAGHSIFLGANNAGQSAPSYILASDCGVGDITDMTAVGFADRYWIMNVHGITQPLGVPPFCAATHATFDNTTPLPLADLAVTTSTIAVSGAGTNLLDVNLQTFLQHTFAADLDISVTSPAGTVVTLSTDNGAGNDNVFNGTVWDDDANPLGAPPYTTNAGMVTDNPYVNDVTAPRLVAEEAMGAFIGEDPNGVWTITISDDLAGELGALNAWSLELTTIPAPITTPASASQTTPTAVPTGPAVVTSTLQVMGLPSYIYDVNMLMTLTHTFSADLDMSLTSPAGTVVTLSTDNGAGNDNTFNGTLWDDDANPLGLPPYTTNAGLATDHPYVNLTTATPLVPEEAMGAFIGEDPNGTWTITISDDLAADGGSLDNWTLDFVTAVCPTTTTTTTTTATTTITIATTTSTTSPGGPVTTSTTLPGGGGGCIDAVTYTSLRCRIGQMMVSTQADVEPAKLADKITTLLTKADTAVARAEEITAAGGPAGKSRRALKKAMRALKKVAKRVGSKGAASTPEAVRNALIAAGAAVQADLQTMIDA